MAAILHLLRGLELHQCLKVMSLARYYSSTPQGGVHTLPQVVLGMQIVRVRSDVISSACCREPCRQGGCV